MTTALFLSSPGAAAEPLPTLPPSWAALKPGETITLTWGEPADGGSDVSHYVIYRGDTWVADVSGFVWVDVAPNGEGYSVAAVGAGGESVAVVALPTSSDCIAWVEGLPPIMVNVWECLDPTTVVDLAKYVRGSPGPGYVVGLPPIFG